MGSHGWCATHVELRIHLCVERLGIVVRKAEMLRGESQLVDEVAYICVVEVHEFVHVGKVEEAAWGWSRGCRQRATIDMLERRLPVGE